MTVEKELENLNREAIRISERKKNDHEKTGPLPDRTIWAEDKLKLTDLLHSDNVEFLIDTTGKLWLNVDGVCAVRIGKVETITIRTPAKSRRKGFTIFKEQIG